MTVPKGTKTAGQVIEHVTRQFGDESGVQIDSADIIRWINQASIEINRKNGLLETTKETDGIPGQASYEQPEDIQEMRAVVYGAEFLHATSHAEALKTLGYRRTQKGCPEYWYMWANAIYLWPIPDKVETLRIDYIRFPDMVAQAGDLLPLPDNYYGRVLEYVLAKAYELDEDWEANAAQMSRFKENLTEQSESQFTMGGSFPVITVVEYD